MHDQHVVLVKPPEISRLNFGTFSLGVLAAAIRPMARVTLIDATTLTIPEAVARVAALSPDLVGLTAMGYRSIPPVAEFIRLFKERGTEASILAGGHGASMSPELILDAGADGVVLGEGESTFQEILNRGIQPGIPGTLVRVNGETIQGPPRPLIFPLDNLDFPDRELMPPALDGVYLMETSRGCPHDCQFCETTRFYGRRWRPKSADRVIREVQDLIHRHDAWIIHFADDNFSASTERVKEICEKLKDQALPAFFMVSARADDLFKDPELLPRMAEARILRVSVGIETLDPDTAGAVGKTITMDVYQHVFNRMRELGIFSIASLIVGLPGETPEARSGAVELCVQACPDSAHFLPFLPQPGIPLSQNRTSFDTDPRDARDADRFNFEFFNHPRIKQNLETLARKDDIQGMLARAALANPLHHSAPEGSLDLI
ncbi:MAG: B12-binding domain-containing radical SAM protein [Candidatus Omnitrophota bacterium]